MCLVQFAGWVFLGGTEGGVWFSKWLGVFCGMFRLEIEGGSCVDCVSWCVFLGVGVWVLMVVVLAVAFLVVLCVGVWLSCGSSLICFTLVLSVGNFGDGCGVMYLCSGVCVVCVSWV